VIPCYGTAVTTEEPNAKGMFPARFLRRVIFIERRDIFFLLE